jgi:endonuclease YncB( thermonuclease family)
MDNFWKNNKVFMAITIGAVIVGVFIYFGLKTEVAVAPKTESPFSAQNSQQTQIKTNSTVDGYSNVFKNNRIAESATTCGASDNTIVTKVIDGDTVVVEGGYHVRLLGMDADEKGYPCYEQAKTRLENLVLSKQVVLEKDISDVDQYGRCLRYIFFGNENINAKLVKEGLAIARFYEPDVKYRAEITNAETYAQQNKIGCKWQ